LLQRYQAIVERASAGKFEAFSELQRAIVELPERLERGVWTALKELLGAQVLKQLEAECQAQTAGLEHAQEIDLARSVPLGPSLVVMQAPVADEQPALLLARLRLSYFPEQESAFTLDLYFRESQQDFPTQEEQVQAMQLIVNLRVLELADQGYEGTVITKLELSPAQSAAYLTILENFVHLGQMAD
jgi:hypothetical protein